MFGGRLFLPTLITAGLAEVRQRAVRKGVARTFDRGQRSGEGRAEMSETEQAKGHGAQDAQGSVPS